MTTERISVSAPVYEYLMRRRDRDGHGSVDSALRDVLNNANAEWLEELETMREDQDTTGADGYPGQ